MYISYILYISYTYTSHTYYRNIISIHIHIYHIIYIYIHTHHTLHFLPSQLALFVFNSRARPSKPGLGRSTWRQRPRRRTFSTGRGKVRRLGREPGEAGMPMDIYGLYMAYVVYIWFIYIYVVYIYGWCIV